MLHLVNPVRVAPTPPPASARRPIQTWNELNAQAEPESFTIAELLPFYREQRREQVIDGRVQRRNAKLAFWMAKGACFDQDKRHHRLGLPTSAWYRRNFIEPNEQPIELTVDELDHVRGDLDFEWTADMDARR